MVQLCALSSTVSVPTSELDPVPNPTDMQAYPGSCWQKTRVWLFRTCHCEILAAVITVLVAIVLVFLYQYL